MGPSSRRYADPVIESIGDSARGDEFALVRLTVDGDRIVSADAPGLERPLQGLTLLEAAAVGGATLAVDALANAIAPIFRATPNQDRVAVAMSGGANFAPQFSWNLLPDSPQWQKEQVSGPISALTHSRTTLHDADRR